MAMRPLFSSLLRMSVLYTFKFRPKGSPKLPGSFSGDSCQAISKEALIATISKAEKGPGNFGDPL